MPAQRLPIRKTNERCAVVDFRGTVSFLLVVSGLGEEGKPAAKSNLIASLLKTKKIGRAVAKLVSSIEVKCYVDSRWVEAWSDGDQGDVAGRNAGMQPHFRRGSV